MLLTVKILFICKENSGTDLTFSYGSTPSGVVGRIARLVGTKNVTRAVIPIPNSTSIREKANAEQVPVSFGHRRYCCTGSQHAMVHNGWLHARYGIRGLRRGEPTWDWPDFNADPEQENLAQLSRWLLNSAPAWEFPSLAIANQY